MCECAWIHINPITKVQLTTFLENMLKIQLDVEFKEIVLVLCTKSYSHFGLALFMFQATNITKLILIFLASWTKKS